MELLETPILSHNFNNGQILYLVNNGEENVWASETEFAEEAITNYWHNIEVVDSQSQRQVAPGKLIDIIPNLYNQNFSFLIQREREEDPLMLVPKDVASEAYLHEYLDKIETVYFSGIK